MMFLEKARLFDLENSGKFQRWPAELTFFQFFFFTVSINKLSEIMAVSKITIKSKIIHMESFRYLEIFLCW